MFLSFSRALAGLRFDFYVIQYASSASVLCCSAGGWEGEEDVDEIWIISSQCLAKPHFAGTTDFQCISPPTQPGSCRPRHLAASPLHPTHSAQPLINQTLTHKRLYLSPPKYNNPSFLLSCCCSTGNAAF